MNFIKVGSQMINLDQVLYMDETSSGVFVYTPHHPSSYQFLLRDLTFKDIEEAIERATTSNRR